MPNTDNGRVTLAVLGEKVDNLDAIIREYCKTSHNNHEDHEKRVRDLEKQATTNEVQHKLLAGTQLASIITAIGSFVGRW